MGQFISFKREINNPWFNPWFILLHTHSNVCATVEGRCLEYLVCITLSGTPNFFGPSYFEAALVWIFGSQFPLYSFYDALPVDCIWIMLLCTKAERFWCPAWNWISIESLGNYLITVTILLQWLVRYDAGITARRRRRCGWCLTSKQS